MHGISKSFDKPEIIKVSSVLPDVKVTAHTNGNNFTGNLALLLRWKRSVYQLLWKHMIVYGIVFISLSILYKHLLNETGRKNFRVIAEHCTGYSRSINLMIMLGFFTSTAMQRLFTMQTTIPGTAKSITLFISSLKSDIPEGPMIIEQFVRWQLLSWILCFRLVCRPLRKQYPDLFALESAGLLTEEERNVLEDPHKTDPTTPRPLVVIDWILLLLKETFLQERFFMDFNYLKNVDILMAYKKSCGNTIKFANQNISPALVQAVILAVYCFGCVTVMARTFTKEEEAPTSHVLIAYVPLMPAMQFFIYFSWLCFGKAAVDPFGDDEDDINVKDLVKSHIENAKRLKDLYNRNLSDVFPALPQREYNDLAQL
ncbi:bestrophin-4-like [Daphnia pulicaria]|uniref:bestrophin-4-like n=1 Tax=Daphnia pulicaria TaxID=35523 RepID=UPI001EEC23A6|nr:bestrophin-4-like [Daphnia pulicaria]